MTLWFNFPAVWARIQGGRLKLMGKARRAKPSQRRDFARSALLRIDGRPVEVALQLNTRAKRLIVKVHPASGAVSVVAPSRRALDDALAFARKESGWIAERLENVPKPVFLELGARIPFRGEVHVIRRGEERHRPVWVDRGGEEPVIRVAGHNEHTARRVEDFLKREARRSLNAHVVDYAAMIGVRPARVVVRDTATRWGSCSSGRILSFSWRLILAPPHILDYVVAHEVAHLREMNHGPRFWRLLESMVGNVERPQAWLNTHGTMLHRYAPRNGG